MGGHIEVISTALFFCALPLRVTAVDTMWRLG